MSAPQFSSVAIVFDETALLDPGGGDVGATERAAVEAVFGVVDAVARVAERAGARVTRVGLSADGPTFLRQVAALDADVVVNFAETWQGQASREAAVAWALEARGIPYTGAPPRALTLCLDKPTTRAVLASADVGVAYGVVLRTPDDAWPAQAPTTGPFIVKPAAQDASHGIDADSVVADASGALRVAQRLFARGLGPALVERYIDGRELNVSIVQLDMGPPRVLPIAEIVYAAAVEAPTAVPSARQPGAQPGAQAGELAETPPSTRPAGLPRILTFASKWDPQSPDYQASQSVEARNLSSTLRRDVECAALLAWQALGMRGYGRVDMRVDERDRPLVIDVNPNPDLSPDAGLALAAGRAGLSYDQLVCGLLSGAVHAGRR